MADDLQALQAELGTGAVKPVYLVQGAERLFVDQAVRAIVAAVSGAPDDPMAVTRLDLAEAGRGAREILAAVAAMSLFGPRQVVVVRAAEVLDKRAEERDDLARYLEAPRGANPLVLVAGDKLLATTRLFKAIKREGRVVQCEPLKPRDVPSWLMAEARRMGQPFEFPAAKLVADLVGSDLLLLTRAMEQLSLYVGAGAPITSADVETCLAATRAHSVFELVDAVADRQTAQALVHLHALFAHREAGLRILAMLVRHFRFLWQVAAGRREGWSQAEVVERLKLHPFQAQKLWSQCGKFSALGLRAIYEKLYVADFRLKDVGLSESLLMERLVAELCAHPSRE
jgi:DNA polymerase-3 subunit delta